MRESASALAARAWKQVRDPSIALLLSAGASVVLRLGSNLVLAHLLMPRVFGLVAITTLVATALSTLAETGVWVAIVRKGSSVDGDWLDQMWTLQAVRGVILYLLALVLVPFVARAYGDPELMWLLPVANIWLLILGIESLQPFVRQKELRPGFRLKLQLASQVVGSTVSIAGALLFPSPWALVAGILAGAAITTILSHAWAGVPLPRPHLTRCFLREQWKLASWLIVSTALGFLGGQIDRLLFPAWFGTSLFGVYSIALTLALVLLMFGQGWADSVYMPAIAKLSEARSETAERQLRSLGRTVGVYAGVGSAMLAGIGPPFFLALYPQAFAPAAVFIQILALTTYMTFLTYLHRRTFLYQGLTRLEASIEAARLFLFLAGLGLATLLGQRQTPTEYVALYAMVQFVVYVGLLVVGRLKKLVHFRDDLPGHLAFVATIAGMTLLGQTLANRSGALVSFLVCAAAGAIICLLTAARLGLPKLPESSKTDIVQDQEFAVPLDPFEPVQS